MSNHKADTFEGQQQILEDLINEVQYMQAFLTAFKDAYWNQILKVEKARMMQNSVDRIKDNFFPPYRELVNDTVDELKKFENELKQFIENQVREADRVSRQAFGD